MTATQIYYVNTIGDAVRLMMDQFEMLPPGKTTERKLVRKVATAFLTEHDTQGNMPLDTFNRLSGPASCRYTACTLMGRMADDILVEAAKNGEDQKALIAVRDMVEGTLNNLVGNRGTRAAGENARYERSNYQAASNVVNLEIFNSDHRNPRRLTESRYLQQCENMTTPAEDTPRLRLQLLSNVMDTTLRWAVDQSFKMALQGENTAGRLLGALQIPMTLEHITTNTSAMTSRARGIRELGFVVGVLGRDLDAPGGRLNTMAVDDYQFRLGLLRLPITTIPTVMFDVAGRKAHAYGTKVSHILEKIVQQQDGWTKPKADRPQTSFTMPAASRLQ